MAIRKLLLGLVAGIAAISFAVTEAEAAKRLGGGGSIGAQRSVAKTPPTATPAKPAQAQPGQTSQAAPAAAPPAAAPASGLAKWAPMLGGLALGGMLGYLMGANGMGGLMLGILLVALLAFAAMFVIRMLMNRNAPQQRPLQYAGGMGNETVAAPPPSQAAGFDARPAAPLAGASASVPAGFDVPGFLRGAKMNYMKLQLANDRGDLAELAEFTSPELFESIKQDVQARGAAKQQVDVLALNADLLEVATEGDKHWASVRFSGTVRETPGDAPVGFEEVWNLAKPVNGSSGWQLAGIQQMH